MVSLSRPSMTVRPDRPPRTACSGRRKTRCLFGEIIALTVMLVLCGPSIYGTAEAQEHLQPPIEIKRLDGTIEFDGMPFEEAWEAVEPFPMTQQLPNYGAEPTERTEVRITYDDEYIYLGGRLYDSDPEGIHPATYQRDRRGLAGDWMIMTLDPHNDKENSLLFGTSPAGNRTDVWFANDTEGDRPVNADWNAFWDAQVGRNDEGWFAEVRVPFSTLRFEPDEEGRVVMGMILFRWIARKQEVHLFPAIPPNWQWANYKASQAQEVVFRDIEPERQVYVTPYVLGGTERRMELLSDGGAYVHSNHPSYEMGVDAKVGVAGHLTLDLTLNTDFAQAEVDDQQVNLSRFSLFFPEKRQFFQEQRGAFDFSTGQVDRVFHSRRIGLQRGEPVRIYGGARLVGRSGPWELGLLNMQTAATDVRSSENMGAYRVRRRVLNRYSHLGAIVTNRITEEGDINAVFGADGQFRFTDAELRHPQLGPELRSPRRRGRQRDDRMAYGPGPPPVGAQGVRWVWLGCLGHSSGGGLQPRSRIYPAKGPPTSRGPNRVRVSPRKGIQDLASRFFCHRSGLPSDRRRRLGIRGSWTPVGDRRPEGLYLGVGRNPQSRASGTAVPNYRRRGSAGRGPPIPYLQPERAIPHRWQAAGHGWSSGGHPSTTDTDIPSR